LAFFLFGRNYYYFSLLSFLLLSNKPTTKKRKKNMGLVRPQNLNDVFLAAAKQASQPTPNLSHNQKVARLYRHSLKTLLSWAVDRDIFNEKATELRARFDANRGVSASAAARLLRVRLIFFWYHKQKRGRVTLESCNGVYVLVG
jgi:hypothetical protein